MALIYIRVAIGRQFGKQHSDYNQSSCQFVAVRRQSASRPGNGSGPQLGLQGGKNCGLYCFLYIYNITLYYYI